MSIHANDSSNRLTAKNVVPPLRSPVTLKGAVVEELRWRIIMGDLPPGMTLRDTEVAQQMGLSNTPVREAFVNLAAEGLVEIIPNKSKRVAPIDGQAMVDLLLVQSHLWELGYQWGGKNVGKAELRELQQSINTQRRAMLAGDRLAAVGASLDFHLVLMTASGNQELVRVSVDRIPLIQRFVILQLPQLPNQEMLDIHQSMYRAFEDRQPENAIALFRQAYGSLLNAAMKTRDKNNSASNSNKDPI